jgi:hypothetical protein
MKIRLALGVPIIVVIIICFGYLNRYEYFKVGRGDGIEWEVRTNRYTNETDVLGNRGWYVAQTSEEWRVLHWNRTHPTYFTPDGSESK